MSPLDDDDEQRPTDVTGIGPVVVRDEAIARVASPHRLVCIAGAELGRTFSIDAPAVTLGRGLVDIPINATEVSRHHARISKRGNDHVIEDLGSANGTFINGILVRSATVLRSGDRVQVGATVFVFAHHDELEERMYRLQRLEALATLAGGLAHDFNNALSVILAGLDGLERTVGSSDPAVNNIFAEVRGAAGSASALARRLLRLGNSAEPLEFEPVQVAPMIQSSVAMMRRQLPPQISIKVDVEPDLVVRGSREELHQMLLNLMLNARDAMPTGGVLHIGGRGSELDGAQAAARQLPARGSYVELVISDTGVGMDATTMARAFEPFFTTKPAGQGTGLGLALIHGIVRRHGGAVVVDSALGRGTTFTIWLAVG